MGKYSNLNLNCMAIGSLPHKNVDEAMFCVKENFKEIPFWPQLSRYNKNEDMIVQFLENMPGLVVDEIAERVYLDNESDEFFEQLEEFFLDYEEILSTPDSDLIDKYAISENNSSTIKPFLEIISQTKPKYAKGQVVGPFTLATSLTDKEKKCAFYDETLREVIVKTLSLKALWQIKEIKKVSPDTIPIIFMDEPSISQLGTSAYITISEGEVINLIKEVSDIIKANGAISAIHCCGKCDWSAPIKIGVDILNLDGYFFAQNLSLFHKIIKPYLENGGTIAWGIVPTLDKDALEKADSKEMLTKFDEAIEYMINKGIDKTLIINQSVVTPSCGAGSLSVELAEKAMKLTKELSRNLKERYQSQE